MGDRQPPASRGPSYSLQEGAGLGSPVCPVFAGAGAVLAVTLPPRGLLCRASAEPLGPPGTCLPVTL